MPKLEIDIQTIFDGIQPSALFGQADEYLAGIGIDPDMPITDAAADKKTGGIIRPVNYEKFSTDSVVDSYPIAVITTPKNSNVYVILKNGKIISYDSSLANESYVGRVNADAEGAWYYNNYIYITIHNDVSRYGPLNGTPAITNNYWTSTLGLTALTSNNYPESLLGVNYLKHHGISHVDGASYLLDYKNGYGYVHQLQTQTGTYEGDTNNGSEYNLLDFPANYMPITIAPYGTDLVVSASLTTNQSIQQGKSALFFFNPADTIPSFYRKVQLPDSICPAMVFQNGYLLGLSGDINGGYRLFQYVGGDTIQTLKQIEEGNPPLQNAIDAIANKLIWAADTTIPMVSSGLWGYGSKSDLFPRGLHHLATSPLT